MIVADSDPNTGFGEQRGVSSPVLHPSVSPTIFKVSTGGLTPRRSLRTGRECPGCFFSCPPPYKTTLGIETVAVSWPFKWERVLCYSVVG